MFQAIEVHTYYIIFHDLMFFFFSLIPQKNTWDENIAVWILRISYIIFKSLM
jgi:hypothetical protein